MIHPVVLCGGSGVRLWPSSRQAFPKQFAPLFGDRSLFQNTLLRFSGPEFERPIVLTNADFRFLATEQCTEIGLSDARVVIEPARRDTAPAALAAALMLKDDPDALMLVAPSDHLIADEDAFREAVQIAATAAKAGNIVTFGVRPDSPKTGYGYLELTSKPDSDRATKITAFVEKPDLLTAQQFLKDGRYLWNAGMFLARVQDWLAAFEAHAADMMEPCQAAVTTGEFDLGFFRLGAEAFEGVRSASIDYAVMEKASNIVTVPLSVGWTDLGSWDALFSASDTTGDGVVTQGDALALACDNVFLKSEDENIQLVGVGLKNVAAIAMRDAVLVVDMDHAQDVKLAVEQLKKANKSQATDYPRFFRPWGWYETLCLGSRFQVKRIMVKPGGILSLQSHHHRSEHWIVVAGTAEVTVDDTTKLVTENESVYIPLGSTHRMANHGKLPMFLIEVQTGAYLGEDDIVRYEDVYART